MLSPAGSPHADAHADAARGAGAGAPAAPPAAPDGASGGAEEPDVIFRAAGTFLAESAGALARGSEPPRLRVLDAGTGRSSVSWLLRSPFVGSWAAVTASGVMEREVAGVVAAAEGARAAGAPPLPPGRVVRASWDEPDCLRGEAFDAVVADYLLGAVDGFTPYRQDVLFERLLQHLAPNGTLVVVGLEPIPNDAPPPADVVSKCARLRDAVFLHAGQRPYREYPLQWVTRALRRAGMRVALVRRFPILYSVQDLVKELNTARSRLPAVRERSGARFADALAEHIDAVEATTRARLAEQPGGKLGFGEDYLVCAVRDSPPCQP
ncbi:hypothetical protein KFE25_012679 [Diacronema lutheri]|uniref:Uncharacterized protein n=1 Tax=Diacronema lutheri TaxID=2081491 RepID=A0A8J5X7Q1_DIALT|nr:hypothetical protein KFE25_012679 [Diacronema lutheri]